MSVDLLETAVTSLGDMRDRVVFLGGATIALWLTDPASRAPRITQDVDVVAEVLTLGRYVAFQTDLRSTDAVLHRRNLSIILSQPQQFRGAVSAPERR